MKAWAIFSALFLLLPIPAVAQLSGEFYLDKTTFAPGEPIFLKFKVTNHADHPEDFDTTGLPDRPGCAGYIIDISRIPPTSSSCANYDVLSKQGCVSNGGGDLATIQPGETYTERILLNFDSELRNPGEYSIKARRVQISSFSDDDKLEVETTLRLRMDADAPPVSDALFQPWVDQLQSDDDHDASGDDDHDPGEDNHHDRNEAAMVLANLAPHSFEGVLLGFADDPDLQWFAPLAFHRLNTPRSIAALAAILDGPPANGQIEASMYLAETGDQRWLPLLLQKAGENQNFSPFVAAAAELGGEKAIPAIVALEKSQDPETAASNVAMALAYTDSRDAIPLLLEYLKNPESVAAGLADVSLQYLTHRRAGPPGQLTPPANYPKWAEWWKRVGATAPIYKAPTGHGIFCISLQPLP